MVKFVMIALAALLLAGLLPAAVAAYPNAHTPMPPTNIEAVDGANVGEVDLTWTAAEGAVSYRIAWISNADYEANNRRGWLGRLRYGNVPSTQTAYTVTGLTPGADYWFIVASIGDEGAPQWAPAWARLQIRAMATTEPTPPPQGPPPPTMTMLADGVYHYFGFFSSSLVVVASDGVLITDVDNTTRGQSLKAEIAKITAAPVTQIVLTHEHFDHVGGTEVFPDAEVICHRNCQPHFDLAVLGNVPTVDRTFADRLNLDVGDRRVELHYLGPGDGDATTIIYLPAEQIVVTSDLYEPRALTHKNWVHDKHFTGVRKILTTISGWPLAHAINAHSPGTNPTDLMENVAYYNDLYDAVKAAVDQAIMQAGGQTFGAYGLYDTLPQTLQLEQYRSWMNYDTSFPAHVERMLLAIYHGD